jgi:hypothetical protein
MVGIAATPYPLHNKQTVLFTCSGTNQVNISWYLESGILQTSFIAIEEDVEIEKFSGSIRYSTAAADVQYNDVAII